MPTTDLNTPSWWGGEDRASGRPSILGLIDNGTLDLRTGALLWLLVDRKSSILAAAGPQLAGKTTLLTALLDLMPPAYRKILTRGRQEDFSFLKDAMPEETYLLVAELSDHTPAYLWGDAVKKLFDALDMGYSMLATMHADTPE
ncbi:MAG: type II secretion system protein E, partial [Chloroflexi bacterium]|nr:type II secretion system protein E [Chloroflexota bacterium]